MALKNTQIPITMAKYEAIMGELITKNKDIPIHESVIKLLEEANKYRIVDANEMVKPTKRYTITRKSSKRSKHIPHKGRKARALKYTQQNFN